MSSIGLLTFSAGWLFCSVALIAELLNALGRRRQVVEGFESLSLNIISLCLLGMGLICFYAWFSVSYG